MVDTGRGADCCETLKEDANISEAARRNGVSRGLLTVWRQRAREAQFACEGQPLFAAVRVTCDEDWRESGAVACKDKPARAAHAATKTASREASKLFKALGMIFVSGVMSQDGTNAFCSRFNIGGANKQNCAAEQVLAILRGG